MEMCTIVKHGSLQESKKRERQEQEVTSLLPNYKFLLKVLNLLASYNEGFTR
jgi:hypothetical protein